MSRAERDRASVADPVVQLRSVETVDDVVVRLHGVRLPKTASSALYLSKEGVVTAVFHSTPAGTAWQHAYEVRCVACPTVERHV
jgi:hypothetical protein